MDSFSENNSKEESPASFSENNSNDEDLALLIYTSGSTGNPKGVIHTHRSFADTVRRNCLNNGMSPKDKTLGIISFSFALSVGEIYDTLFSGAELILLDNEERMDPGYVRSVIADRGITSLYINPNMLKRLDLHGTSLRVAQTVGERMSDFYTDEYRVINIFGASETFAALSFDVDKAYENTHVGKPFDGMRAYLVKEDGNEAAPGEEGEICVAGLISRGYLNLEEQTKNTFTPNPFSDEEDYSILYHTNDIGKMLPDGNIVYVNRKDWMVKINGQRVEMGEIEVRIATDNDAVETAVVKAFENEYGLTYLAAYYKLKSGMTVTADEIKEGLLKKLPEYMIPSFFVELESFPLNPSGKIDRKSIAAPDAASFKAEYIAPQNELQEKLCSAFEKILKCGRVGIKDDFFAMGGDSLLAMNLQDESGVSTEIIYSGRTPEGIAEALAGEETTEQKASSCDIYIGITPGESIDGIDEGPATAPHDGTSEMTVQSASLTEYPLNPFERGMYFEQKLDPESMMYNLTGFYEISGAGAEKIKASLESTFRAHEAFHSVYREKDGEILRVLTDEIPEIMSIVVTVLVMQVIAKKKGCRSFQMLDDAEEKGLLDMSIGNRLENAEEVPRKVRQFLLDSGIEERIAGAMAVSAEELAVNAA